MTDAMLSLHDLGLKGGDTAEREIDLDLAPLRLGGLDYTVVLRDAGVHVTVERITGGYLLTVAERATVYGPCYRCLREVVVPVDAEQQEFVPTHPEKWDEADLSPFIADFVADIAALAREAVVLALPGQILCREECPGICPQCGSSLEAAERCSCEAVLFDPRWEALRGLGAVEAEESGAAGD
jgi:uncharacterized protein